MMKNESGITPSGNRVLVKPDDIEKKTSGGIIIPDTTADQHMLSQSIGTLIAVGPDSWQHVTETVYELVDGSMKPVRKMVRGYSEPFAKPGDRVAFAKFGGLQVEGEDGKVYRILNDEDVTCRVTEGVNFTDIKSRNPLGEK